MWHCGPRFLYRVAADIGRSRNFFYPYTLSVLDVYFFNWGLYLIGRIVACTCFANRKGIFCIRTGLNEMDRDERLSNLNWSHE